LVNGIIVIGGDFMIICNDTKESVHTYYEYLKTEHWKKVRERKFNSKSKYVCECCSVSKGLQLHHKSYKRVGCERLNDLVWLCEKCHSELHKTKPKGSKLWSASRKLRKSNSKKVV